MKNVLIAAKNAEACRILSGFLDGCGCDVATATDGMTLRAIDVSGFDVIFISLPLSNESGADLFAELRERTNAHLIALCKPEIVDAVNRKISPSGAYIVTKPLYKGALTQAISFCDLYGEHEAMLRNRNAELEKKIEEQKLVFRAKLVLIEKQNLSEGDAHKHIQQLAMNSRKSQADIAAEIIEQNS